MPPKKATRKPKYDGVTLRIDYDGEKWDVPADPNKIPNVARRELFVQSEGLTFQALVEAMSSGRVDEFFVAAFLFLAKRAAGESVRYRDVEASFDAEKLTEVRVVDPDEVDEAPEA